MSRSRNQMDDNEDFITTTKKNKKNRQDSVGDDRPTDHQQQEQQYTPRHRYPTRLQYHNKDEMVDGKVVRSHATGSLPGSFRTSTGPTIVLEQN